MESSFLRGESSDARGSPDGQTLLGYAEQLRTMSDMFSHEVDLRDITKANIDKWEKELRDIVKGIKKLQKSPYRDILLTSCDGAQTMIQRAIDSLYVASYILQKETCTTEDVENLFPKFRQCSAFLLDAVDIYFKI